ncbi:MAG: 3-oxoadipate enol-lactonase [Sphingomonas sp.]|jgi:3-oxoadipate enol-lactonase|nr:3-oxoadipate enol-lactonase [Sphingomonas sp.]
MSVGRITTGDGCEIAYRFDGPEDAPVLMLSNSLGTAMAMWEPQMAALTSVRRVLRYDSRGHGSSGCPVGAYSIDRLGRDVIEVLDALDLARVDFCGLSKGGMIGQWLGWRAPDRTGKLILANTSAYMGPPEGWDTRIRMVEEQGVAAMVAPVIQRWFRPSFIESSRDAISPVEAMLLATPAHGYAGCCAAIRDMDQRRALALIAVPTLIIAGTDDPATPLEHSELLASRITSSELICLPAAHLSNIESPQGFNDQVAHFLAS